MYCAKCGTGLPEDAIVCYKCATPTVGYAVPQKNRSRSPLVIVAVVVSLILVAIFAVIFIGYEAQQSVVRAGNETSAAQTVDNIRKFQALYASRNKGDFAQFDELIRKVGLDQRFHGERPTVNSYTFTMVVEPSSINKKAFFSISADPMAGGGSRHFYTDSSLSSIKATDENRPAKADEPDL